jgi:transcription initiation factor TFIID subunit 7
MALYKKRFEDALKKLTADLEMKIAQRDEIQEQQRMKKAGIVPEDLDAYPDSGVREGDGELEEGDLFGDMATPGELS